MKFLCIFLLFPFLAQAAEENCADCDRRPALTVAVPAIVPEVGERLNVPSCLDIVKSYEERITSDRQLEIVGQYFRQAGELYPETSAALEASKRKRRGALSCQEAADLRYLRRALEVKLQYVHERLPEYQSIMDEGAAQLPRHSAEKALDAALKLHSCLRDLPGASEEELDQENPCVRASRINFDMFSYIRGHEVLSVLLSQECRHPDSGKMKRADLLPIVRKLDARTLKQIKELGRKWLVAKAAMQKLGKTLPAEIRRLSTNPPAEPTGCPIESARALAGAATVKLDVGELARGSGFYLRSGRGPMLASARHVPAVAGGSDHALHAVTPGAGGPLQFKIEQGQYDFGNDAVLLPVRRAENAVELVSASDRPQPGQILTVSGFPSVAGEALRQVDCKFLGYALSMNSSTAYLLHCPTYDSLEGASGGPLTGEDGRAWGIVGGQLHKTGLVTATPIGLDPAGAVQIGVQGTFLSDQCYGPFGELEAPHRCQIFPGSEQPNVPLRGN